MHAELNLVGQGMAAPRFLANAVLFLLGGFGWLRRIFFFKVRLLMKTEFSDTSIGVRRYRADDAPLLFEAPRESVKELSTGVSWCHLRHSIDDRSAFLLSRDAEWV